MQKINIPTLFLNSKDDMFAPYKSYPIEKIKSNPYTGMILTKYGGKYKLFLILILSYLQLEK
jgi:predicted alpha/beta-fold hydrolase